MKKRRIVVGISGASGVVYGVRLLQELAARPEWESHLVVTRSGALTLRLEMPDWSLERVQALADVVHRPGDVSACIASGSFLTDAMVVAPCSMKSLAAITHGYGDNLLVRAADVTLKERRRLILLPRETPLHSGHLQNMLSASQLGAIILPPLPAFYHRPRTLEEVVDHTVAKILDLLAIEHQLSPIWQGPPSDPAATADPAELSD